MKGIGAFALTLALSTPALAGGYLTNGLPLAGQPPYTSTIPLTGNERVPLDTLLPNGAMPQSEAATLAQIAQYMAQPIPPGVVCDGTTGATPTGTDNTSALNAAFAAAKPYTAIALPAGVCLFSGTLNIGAKHYFDLHGEGKNATILLYYNPSAGANARDLVYVGGASYATIRDLSIRSATTMISGAALHLQFCSYCWVLNFDFDEYNEAKTIWDGIWVERPGWVTVSNYLLRGAQDDDAVISGAGLTDGSNYDAWFLGGKIGAAGHAGWHLAGGFDGAHLFNTEVTSNNIGVLVDHSIAPYQTLEWDVEQSYIDYSTQSNIIVDESLCQGINLGVGHSGGNITRARNGPNILVKNWPGCRLVIDSALIMGAVLGSVGDGIAIQDQSTILSIAPETIITGNGRYGISSTLTDGTTPAKFDNLYSNGQVYSNSGGVTDGNVAFTKVGKGPVNQIAIASGFGTSPSISAGYSTEGFVINVGTGGTAGDGVITMPLASVGWNCKFNDPFQHTAESIQTGNTSSSVTVTNYSFTTGAEVPWGSGDTLAVQCVPR